MVEQRTEVGDDRFAGLQQEQGEVAVPDRNWHELALQGGLAVDKLTC
jgi:hypothetical protein